MNWAYISGKFLPMKESEENTVSASRVRQFSIAISVSIALLASACSSLREKSEPEILALDQSAPGQREILPPDQAAADKPALQHPEPIIQPDQVPILRLPHPSGFSTRDLQAFFKLSGAPRREDLATCSAVIIKLHLMRATREEIRSGVQELVLDEPMQQHWCYYDRLLTLDEQLRGTPDLVDLQNLVLDTFQVLLPMAQAFQLHFKDSRYLRWAIQRYRTLSPVVFFRRVDLTPETTQALVQIENPFSSWKNEPKGESVLQKFGLKSVDSPAETTAREPASESSAKVP